MKCINGFVNWWAMGSRTIKCKTKNHPDEGGYDPEKPITYRWLPIAMRNADYICDHSLTDECKNNRQKYNVSDKYLKWEIIEEPSISVDKVVERRTFWQSRKIQYVFR